jgi:FtsZ-binding cell division protein ZapB
LPVFDKEKIQKLIKPQEIKTLKEKENKLVQEVPELQRKIEETRSDVVWQ